MSNDSAIDLEKIKETFFIECEEHILSMESSILELEARPGDGELLNAIFRDAHSLKGNSGCLGFRDINSFTHLLEAVLDRLRNGGISLSAELVSLLLASVDCVKRLVEAAKSGVEGCVPAADGAAEGLRAVLGNNVSAVPERRGQDERQAGTSASQAGLKLFKISFTPGLGTFRSGIDPINHILSGINGAGETLRTRIITTGLPDIEHMDPESSYLSWEVVLLTREDMDCLEGIFEFIRDDSRVSIEPILAGSVLPDGAPLPKPIPERKMIGEILIEENAINRDQLDEALKKQSAMHKEEPLTIRVAIGKIDKMLNLVGELVITQSMVAQLAQNPSIEKLKLLQTVSAQLERNSRELEEGVMSMRMFPVGSVFRRFARLVRDTAGKGGKQAALFISGEDTELDKTVIEKISDPLTHLIRNAVDHGLEPPSERAAKGKAATGAVRLNACHEGGYVILTVEDDGAGLGTEKIIKKAVEKGLIEANAALSEAQALDLIFRPGFSTAEAVTDVSGRGVGMDVVKRNIEDLGGSVFVESKKGAGTKITLRMPLTLAILNGLTVRLGVQTFIIPTASVAESLRPRMQDLKTLQREGEVVNLRGKYIPLVRLCRVFGMRPCRENPWESLVIVVMACGGRYALMVDELVGEQQVVVKSMGDKLRNLPGIAGATVLGDGRVALIMDVEGAVRRSIAA